MLNFQLCDELNGETLISLLYNTLLNSGTPKLIQKEILRATLNLLNFESEDKNLQIFEIPQKSLKYVKERGIIFKNKLIFLISDNTFGIQILLPNLPKLLNFLSQKIPKNVKANLNLPIIYLDILNK